MATIPAGMWQVIRLRNFRRFEDTGPIALAPVTLFFGKNSSGKTSMLRAPLLVKQLVEARSDEVTLVGADVDFGSYRELVHNGQLRRDVCVSFVVNDPRSSNRQQQRIIERVHPAYRNMLDSLLVEFTLHWNVRNSRVQIETLSFTSAVDSTAQILLKRRGPSEFSVDFPLDRHKVVVSDLPLTFPSLRFVDLSPEPIDGATPAAAQKAATVNALDFLLFQCVNRVAESARRLIHVGPLRQMPDRAYRTEQSGQSGSGASVVEILDRERAAQRRVSLALSHMGMAKEVQLKQLAPGYVGIVLIDPQTGRADNLADVGFGVSQVLPMLAVLSTAPPGSTVLVEQPELHLHPDAQGALADVLIELSEERQLTLVLESHSEHLLLRLQRRVAEGALDPENVAAYFVDSGAVKRAKISELGRLDTTQMPAGFFEEEWADAVRLAQAAAKRRP